MIDIKLPSGSPWHINIKQARKTKAIRDKAEFDAIKSGKVPINAAHDKERARALLVLHSMDGPWAVPLGTNLIDIESSFRGGDDEQDDEHE